MALPANLERLRQIPIDTLGLSESTQALLKWFGMTSILDCIAVFCLLAQERHPDQSWPRFIVLLFAEVKPKLIAPGYWDLVMDADVWRILREQGRCESWRCQPILNA